MSINKMSIFVYNNNNAEVILDGKSLYTNKETAYSFILCARKSMKETYWNKAYNGDETYIFVK